MFLWKIIRNARKAALAVHWEKLQFLTECGLSATTTLFVLNIYTEGELIAKN